MSKQGQGQSEKREMIFNFDLHRRVYWRAGRLTGFEGIAKIGGFGLAFRHSGNSGGQCVSWSALAIVCEGNGRQSERVGRKCL